MTDETRSDHDRLETRVHDVAGRIDTHEAVCAERYSNINRRLTTIETMMWGVIAAVGSATFTFVFDAVFGK
jgi:hypothetical protein